jgi:very-short-patch-repair endonuclease
VDERDYRRLLKARSAAMRRQPTEAEKRLWRALSGSKSGYKFRRQKIIGSRICDFFCPAKNTAVEVDGSTHTVDADRVRDSHLAESGVTVIYVTNYDVMTNIEGVVEYIVTRLDELGDRWTPHPNPSPEGEGLQ